MSVALFWRISIQPNSQIQLDLLYSIQVAQGYQLQELGHVAWRAHYSHNPQYNPILSCYIGLGITWSSAGCTRGSNVSGGGHELDEMAMVTFSKWGGDGLRVLQSSSCSLRMVSRLGLTFVTNGVRGSCGRENTWNDKAEETVIVWMNKMMSS